MKEITLKLTAEESERLIGLLNDLAGDQMDDGREGHPDGELLYKVAAQVTKAVR